MSAPPEGRRVVTKKKGGGHGHHGGAWKVAYADFVTAMMALFMVMWLLASTDAESRKEISQYFRTGILPDGDLAMQRAAQSRPSVIEEAPIPSPKKPGASMAEDAKDLGDSIQQMIKTNPELAKLASQVSITMSEEGILIEAVDRDGQGMLFDLSSAELKPALVTFLAKLAPVLAQRDNKIRVMGHTDARPYVSKAGKTNWDLSYERATKARVVLEASGLPRGQVSSVQAYGPSMPRNPADPYAAENRRLAILVLHQPEATPTAGQSAGGLAAGAPRAGTAPPAAEPDHGSQNTAVPGATAPPSVAAPVHEAAAGEHTPNGAPHPAPAAPPRQAPAPAPSPHPAPSASPASAHR